MKGVYERKPRQSACPRRKSILDFIQMYLTCNGYSPTYEEIRSGVGLGSTNTVEYHIAGTDVSNKKPDGTARLETLFRFLSRSRYSPLLKGAVAHAFILATQPFIAGNGRIARFLNFTILTQGGFRFHHSLSGIIAGHSQEYIQAVRGLFLPSNAGSLTAFVGFILEMTADAIETAPEDKVRPVSDNSHDGTEGRIF